MAVYFIRAGEDGPVKIGRADDVAARLLTLQTGNHIELSLFRIVEGGQAVEHWLHRHYRARRLRGEWFRYCPTMEAIEPPTLVDRPRPEWSGRLAEARAAVNLSQATIAKLLGVSQSAIADWETGRCQPSLANFASLAGLTETTPEWLAFGKKRGAA